MGAEHNTTPTNDTNVFETDCPHLWRSQETLVIAIAVHLFLDTSRFSSFLVSMFVNVRIVGTSAFGFDIAYCGFFDFRIA